jgi:hypothetical protein
MDKYITFFKAHERALLILGALAVILLLGNHYLDSASAAADARNQAAQSVLQAQKDANAQTAAQVQAAQEQYQALAQQLNAQNAKLLGQIASLSQALAARQKVDAALPLPDLALRWQALLNVPSGIAATPAGLNVSPSVSVQTVQALESLPVIKQQLADETTLAGNKDKQLDSQNALVVGLQSQVSGLNLQLVDTGKACDARVAAINANARKSKRNWFIRGAAVGGAIVAYIILHA